MPDETSGESLSHLDASGNARMVDIGEKGVTRREAKAEALVSMSKETFELLRAGNLPKGEALSAARIAGIAAAKRTPELIPLCHPLRIDSIDVDFDTDGGGSAVRVVSKVRATDRTGVEMEALVAAAIAALTIYDMCKAVERGVEITGLRLIQKSGGKSGVWER